jgi:hypothetical protein
MCPEGVKRMSIVKIHFYEKPREARMASFITLTETTYDESGVEETEVKISYGEKIWILAEVYSTYYASGKAYVVVSQQTGVSMTVDQACVKEWISRGIP